MYDTASRTIVIHTETGESLGPNAYQICHPFCRKQNCAPFLSTCDRAPSFIKKLNTQAIYDLRSGDKKIKGGGSVLFTAERFVYKCDDGPSPGKYDLTTPRWVKKKMKLDPTKPKIYACRVPYTITTTAPSIPTKIDENGYDIDDDGNIIKVPRDIPKPQSLEILSQFPGDNGCKWATRSSKRFDLQGDLTPGPGPAAHNVELPKCLKCEIDEEYRAMARLFTFIPRFVEAQEMKVAKEGLPGPGEYDVSFKAQNRGESINSKPFISGSSRFRPMSSSDAPPPTRYTICDCKHAGFSRKCTPFGFDSPRFKQTKMGHAPGPASYDIKGPIAEKMEKKRNPYALCVAPFNQTAKRDINFAPRDAEITPSAADYPMLEESDDDDETERAEPTIKSSMFKSKVDRFPVKCRKDELGPTTYNVANSYEKIEQHKFYEGGMFPFSMTGPRATTPTAKQGVPSPGEYEADRLLPPHCRGYRFNVTPRFKSPPDSPGPGSYNVHPQIEWSTYKAYGTHNLKLKENVLRKKLRLSPKSTRRQWLKQLKATKLLTWFDLEQNADEQVAFLVQKLFENFV